MLPPGQQPARIIGAQHLVCLDEPQVVEAQPIVQLKPDPHAWSRPSGEFRKPKLGFTAPFLLEPGVTTPDCGFCHRVPQSRCFESLPCILSPRLDLLCALEGLARRPPPAGTQIGLPQPDLGLRIPRRLRHDRFKASERLLGIASPESHIGEPFACL